MLVLLLDNSPSFIEPAIIAEYLKGRDFGVAGSNSPARLATLELVGIFPLESTPFVPPTKTLASKHPPFNRCHLETLRCRSTPYPSSGASTSIGDRQNHQIDPWHPLRQVRSLSLITSGACRNSNQHSTRQQTTQYASPRRRRNDQHYRVIRVAVAF